MAWLCQRCLRKVYPRKDELAGAVRFVLEWKYRRRDGELSYDLHDVRDLKDSAVITHLRCESPEQDGFANRIRIQLRMPKDSDHPLLI